MGERLTLSNLMQTEYSTSPRTLRPPQNAPRILFVSDCRIQASSQDALPRRRECNKLFWPCERCKMLEALGTIIATAANSRKFGRSFHSVRHVLSPSLSINYLDKLCMHWAVLYDTSSIKYVLQFDGIGAKILSCWYCWWAYGALGHISL